MEQYINILGSKLPLQKNSLMFQDGSQKHLSGELLCKNFPIYSLGCVGQILGAPTSLM